MIKFFTSKQNPEIHKVVNINGDDKSTAKILGLIGQIDTMIKANLIYPEGLDDEDRYKWLIIRNDKKHTMYRMNSIDEAKDFCRLYGNKWIA